MKNFKTWLSEAGSYHPTGEFNPNATAAHVSGQSYGSNNGFSLDSNPQGYNSQTSRYSNHDTNTHWSWRMFTNWYADGRGRWDEVQQAAQKNPQINQILQKIAQEGQRSGFNIDKKTSVNPGLGGWDDPEFDLDADTMMEKLADELENAVRQVNPHHGYRNKGNQSDFEIMSPSLLSKDMATKPGTFAKQQQRGNFVSPSMQQTQPWQSKPEQGNASQVWNMRNPADTDTQEIVPLVRQLWHRVDDIEAKIKSISAGSAA